MKPGPDVLVPPVTPGDRARARDAGLVPTSRGPVSAAVAEFLWDHRPNRGADPPEPVPEYMPEYPHPDSPRARRSVVTLAVWRPTVATAAGAPLRARLCAHAFQLQAPHAVIFKKVATGNFFTF